MSETNPNGLDNQDNQGILINLNLQMWDLACQGTKWARVAYHDALTQLVPVEGVQLVHFHERKILKGAMELVQLGILTQYRDLKGAFTVPRTTAFATFKT